MASRLPADLIELLIGVQGEAEIIAFRIGQRFIGVDHLPDDVEIVSLGFLVDGAVKFLTSKC